nr:hypothetical protein [Tanacetum cinerariifolium]
MGHDTIFASTCSHENTKNEVVEIGDGGKRRKRQKVCKNKEERQRMNHNVVEKNRRKMVNQHLGVLLSLMPESYIQRSDQASIVGGAISFVKELECHLQTLEAKKFTLTQQQKQDAIIHDPNGDIAANNMNDCEIPQLPLYFRKIFSSPQYTWSQLPNNNLSKSNSTIANIEVNLVNEHANLWVLMRKQLTQLSKIVGFLEISRLTILHLNVTTLDPFVLYSISLKVEEGCGLDSADEIANAVHRAPSMEASVCSSLDALPCPFRGFHCFPDGMAGSKGFSRLVAHIKRLHLSSDDRRGALREALSTDCELFVSVGEALKVLDQWLCGVCMCLRALSRACHHADGITRFKWVAGDVEEFIVGIARPYMQSNTSNWATTGYDVPGVLLHRLIAQDMRTTS